MKYCPFDEKSLVKYLKGMDKRKKHISDRQKLLDAQMKLLDRHKVPIDKIGNGETIEGEINLYALKSPGSDEMGGGGSQCNPDLLYNQWMKAYLPYETERKIVARDMDNLMLERRELECVQQCICALHPDEKELIEQVYVGAMKVRDYCNSQQIGHDTYDRLRNSALCHLIKSCNAKRKILFDEVNHEKNSTQYGIVISDSGYPGGSIYGVISIRRLHKRTKPVPENRSGFHIWKENGRG